MFVLANLIQALATILSILINILTILILVRALISWVSADPYNPLVQFLYKTTEPLLEPIRRILPAAFSIGIDLSPIVAFFVLTFVKLFIVNTLLELALRMKFYN